VQATEQQVIVTAGAKGAFDLLLTALVEPGSVVAMEDPGYPPFRLLAEARGARVVPVPVDEEGIIPEALPDRAAALHVTPSHQFPLGAALSLDRRRAILEWAARNQAVVIEDDYDSDFRFVGRPLEPLHLLDRHGVVAYVGTFSKSMSPALRLGYVVVPPSLAPALASLSAAVGVPPGHAPQRALAAMLDDGSMARHIHRCRRSYGNRHARVRELAAGLGTVVPSLAGLHLTVLLESRQHELELINEARQRAGVAVEGLSWYRARPDSPDGSAGLCLGFGRVTMEQLDEVAETWPRNSR
jgi:GntR family transcriptional regulator/MocR family aminotransferase